MSQNTPAGVPVIDTDPYDEAVLRNPHSFYEELREAGPVVWLSARSLYATGRFEEVQQIMSNNAAFLSGRGVGFDDVESGEFFRPPSIILESDGAAHDHVRGELMSILSSSFVRGIRKEWIAKIDKIVDEAVSKRSFDMIEDIAYRVPLEVLADEVGFRGERRDDLISYGDNVFNANGPSDTELHREALRKGPRFQQWVAELCERGTAAPGSIAEKLWAKVDTGDLTAKEAGLLVRTFYAAGVDSSATALGNALASLAADPEQYARLHADPGLAKLAGEETIRLTSVVQVFFRHVIGKIDIGGVTLPAGSRIGVWMASANRDPRRWGPDADQLDVSRDAGGQLAFGAGDHMCAGMGLARLQMDAVLSALASKVKRIELTAEPTLRLNNTVRSWATVPVTVEPA